jgi:hypothetical protein
MSQNDGILIWRDPADWNKAVHRLLSESIPKCIKLAIEKAPREYFYYDSKWQGERRIKFQTGEELPGIPELLIGFKETYPKVRMFHACRTNNIASYLEKGLRLHNSEEQLQRAKDIFISDRFPQLTEDLINRAANILDQQGRGNKVSFGLDDMNLITHDQNYIEYGGEYIFRIAQYLTSMTNVDCKKILHEIGVPTILVCDIPVIMIPESVIFNLFADELIRYTILYPYKGKGPRPSTNFGISLERDIPSNLISSYYQPIIER